MVIVLWHVCNFDLQACHGHGPVYPEKQFCTTGLEYTCNLLLWVTTVATGYCTA